MVYDKVMSWQNPVKQGFAEVEASLKVLGPLLAKSQLGKVQKAQVQVMVNQAQDIVMSVKKDGSWGVHAPAFTKGKVEAAKVLVQGALASLQGGTRTAVKASAPNKG
jgi:hypothetical protein